MSSLTSQAVRVRFAPSPTGYLHVGGLRTALFNYLFARHHGGKFVLRIEDTDRVRYVEGATENLFKMLHWAGLDPDESPEVGGEYGPYIQSQRLDIYRTHIDQLLSDGYAYYAFDTQEQLQDMRKRQRSRGMSDQRYDRQGMTNSLTLSESEVKARLEAGEMHVVRLAVPENRKLVFEDVVRGRVEIESQEVDDQILLKSDGYPTYHLANVIDDHLMEITHVIRGEEWLSSVPKHLLLYEYLGWEMPVLAHLPLIFNPDGSKMSKRDAGKGDESGRRFDPDVATYREGGYLRDALLNYVALLGWNPGEGDERQVFSLGELIQEFSLERVGRARAIFDLTKLQWINSQHIKRKRNIDLLELVKPLVQESGCVVPDDEYLLKVIEQLKERVRVIHDFVRLGEYFFHDPETYEEKGLKKHWKEDSAQVLADLAVRIERLDSFGQGEIERVVRELAEDREISTGRVIHPTRLAVSGVSVGPGLFELLDTLGRDTVVRRLQKAVERLE